MSCFDCPALTSLIEFVSQAIETIKMAAQRHGLDIAGGTIRRSSSRFCLGVEHGDYNGTELFGVGTDRFIWMGYKANKSGKIRIFSQNMPEEGAFPLLFITLHYDFCFVHYIIFFFEGLLSC